MENDKRLKLLAVAHLVIGLWVGWYSTTKLTRAPLGLVHSPFVFQIALVLCQACLLGAWAALSSASWKMRRNALLAGMAYLFLALAVGREPGESVMFALMPPLVTVGLAAALAVLRQRTLHVEWVNGAAPVARRDGLRLSIRGLMVFTLAVALVGAGLRSIRGALDPGPSFIPLLFWVGCFVVVCLATLWSGLGAGRFAPRSLAVLALAAVVGTLMPVGSNAPDWRVYFYFIACQVVHAALVLASLLVVRSCGYRLVRAAPVAANRDEPSVLQQPVGSWSG